MASNDWLGHNQASFDQVVEESLLRGLYLTQLNALVRCVRDPRMSARHAQVLAEIIERTNAKTGMAFPGRTRLAQDVIYYVEGEPRRYSERSVGQTISELIECGYIMAAKRAPPGGGRALSHYVTVAPPVEELQAAISEWCTKVRGQPKRERPAHWRPDDNAAIVVNKDGEKADDNTAIDDNTGVVVRSDDNAAVAADDNAAVATVTGRVLTGKEDIGGDAFEEFWGAYPSGRKRGKGEVKAIFAKIVAGKHKVGFATPAELVNGAKRYAGTRPDPEYVPLPATWLNQGRWMDDGDSQGAVAYWWQDAAKVAAMTPERWEKGIAKFGAERWDVINLGPPPGTDACVVPQSVCRALRLTEKYDPQGFARHQR